MVRDTRVRDGTGFNQVRHNTADQEVQGVVGLLGWPGNMLFESKGLNDVAKPACQRVILDIKVSTHNDVAWVDSQGLQESGEFFNEGLSSKLVLAEGGGL